MKRHLVLVGLPGSGKSTVGRLVARLLDTAISDLDELTVSAAGMSVAEVFATHGEARFRQMERAAMDGQTTGTGKSVAWHVSFGTELWGPPAADTAVLARLSRRTIQPTPRYGLHSTMKTPNNRRE